MIRSDKRLKLLYVISDLLTLITVFTGVNLFFRGKDDFVSQDYLFLFTLSLVWIYLTSRNKVYFLHLHNTLKFRAKNHLKNHIEFTAVLSVLYILLGVPVYSHVQFGSFLVIFPLTDMIVNYMVYLFVGRLRRNGKNIRKALVVGAGRTGVMMDEYFKNTPDLGYKIIGFLEDNPKEDNLQQRILGPISGIGEILKTTDVDEVIIALPTHLHERIQYVVDKVDYYGIRVRLIPDFKSLLGRNYGTTNYGSIPIINIREISLDRLRLAFLKQVFDFIFSLMVIIFLAPVFVILAIVIKLESPGPVFYCPIRMGQGGRSFKVFKFRSMFQNDAATGGKMSTKKNDERITRVGRIIRKYSLDELPQFFNVLMGDMSVVGPRPHRIFLNQVMQKEVDNYMIRHYLKPGITGWAQVNGWRGPTDTEKQKHGRTEHDLWYVENWTPFLDAKIIYLTIFGEKTFKTAF
ncbi:MAG: undecaprenyl-phosphate glucose phosphotransferase [Chitinophagaceae bacterium]